MKTYIVTSYGGVHPRKDREYAIMAWYLCASIELYDANNINVIVGAPKGYSKNLADFIARDFSFCKSVLAPAKPDKFCSKINAMRRACDLATEGDIICYLDADVMTYGSLAPGMAKFIESNKTLMTESRPRQREEARKFRSWVVGLRMSGDTVAFIDKWLYHSMRVKHKFSDPLALYKTWKEFSADATDVADCNEMELKACHFGGYKFGSKDQSKSRGPFGHGHKGAMLDARTRLKKQPIF